MILNSFCHCNTVRWRVSDVVRAPALAGIALSSSKKCFMLDLLRSDSWMSHRTKIVCLVEHGFEDYHVEHDIVARSTILCLVTGMRLFAFEMFMGLIVHASMCAHLIS